MAASIIGSGGLSEQYTARFVSSINRFSTLLKSTTLSHLKPSILPILTLPSTSSLGAALDIFLEKNIHSIPITQSSIKEGGKEKFLSMLDVVDVVGFLVLRFEQWKKMMEGDSIAHFFTRTLFTSKTIDSVIHNNEFPLTKRSLFLPINSTIFDTIAFFIKNEISSCAVINEEGYLVSLITSSMLMDYLYQLNNNINNTNNNSNNSTTNNNDIFSSFTISDIHVFLTPSEKKILKVNESTSAINAFELLRKGHRSEVVIVDDDGRLIDTFSDMDLKAIGTKAKSFERLWENIKDYKQQLRNDLVNDITIPNQLVYVTANDSLAVLLKYFSSSSSEGSGSSNNKNNNSNNSNNTNNNTNHKPRLHRVYEVIITNEREGSKEYKSMTSNSRRGSFNGSMAGKGIVQQLEDESNAYRSHSHAHHSSSKVNYINILYTIHHLALLKFIHHLLTNPNDNGTDIEMK